MPDDHTSSAYQQIKTEERKREIETPRELRPLADPSDAKAQFNLGKRYVVGEDIAQDDAEAVNWFRKAASG